ncbi:MAG: hypothetical protein ACHQ16_07395 [Candidatus Lutacidiplasmatales archaeon]
MRRRSAVRFGVVFLPVLVLVAVVVVFVTTLPPPTSPDRPGAPAYSAPLQFPSPNASYGGSRIWYNFSLTVNQPNLTWTMLRFSVTPGPLTKGISNWSLSAIGRSSEVVATFQLTAGNWTSASPAIVVTGDLLSLETDSSLTFGEFGVSWPSLGPGSYGVELL